MNAADLPPRIVYPVAGPADRPAVQNADSPAEPRPLSTWRRHVRHTIGQTAYDILSLVIAFLIGTLLGLIDPPQFLTEARATVALSLLYLALIALAGGWMRWQREDETAARLAGASALAMVCHAALMTLDVATTFPLMIWPMAALIAVALRLLPGVGSAARINHGLVIGKGGDAANLPRGMRTVAQIDLKACAKQDPATLRILVERLTRAAGMPLQSLTIVIAPSPDEDVLSERVCAGFSATGLPVARLLPGFPMQALRPETLRPIGGDFALVDIPAPVPLALRDRIKRMVDVGLSLTLLIVLAPVLAALTTWIAISDPGPIFYAQTRVGRNGRRFRCLKFRSMRVDAEIRLKKLLATDSRARAEWQTHQKLREDPRITRVGALLRQTSLDELPQLWNVMRGEMSLVGPRPIVAPEIAGYASDRAYAESVAFKAYLALKPGLTGLWQVSGRAEMPYEERIRLDVWYHANRSFWLDLTLMIRTAFVVVARRGS